MVTTAVSAPKVRPVTPVRVSCVGVAAVTIPDPLDNDTVLFPGVGENPNPFMVNDADGAITVAVLDVMTGKTLATCTAAPLLPAEFVTITVSGPATGLVPNITVNDVVVAAVTVPVAPLLKVTVLFGGVLASKPVPVTVSAVSFA